jgi:hypothetical protein
MIHLTKQLVLLGARADLGATGADQLTWVRGRRPCAKRGRKAGEVSVSMSGPLSDGV